MRVCFLFFIIAGFLLPVDVLAKKDPPDSAESSTKPFEPTSSYTKKSIHGFTVLVSKHSMNKEQQLSEVMKELDRQLAAIIGVLPSEALSSIKGVKIWVEWGQKKNGGAEFHPSEGWLRNNNYNPEKVDSVEISNADNFVKWSHAAQPCMVLHEMAHAYHHLVLGDGHKAVKDAYQKALESKVYDSVVHVNGQKKRAYALNNEKEYFAELSEAYFGKNDFFPFDNSELKTHDPVGYQLIYRMWKIINNDDK